MVAEIKAPPQAFTNEKIEMFVNDSKAKNRLKCDLVQVRGIVGRPKVSKGLISDLVEQFAIELSGKSTYFAKSSPKDLKKLFEKAADKILQFAPSNVAIQATKTPSIYMKAEINHQNLHVDLIFSEETGRFEEAVVNIFSNKTQKLNVFGTIEEVFSDVQNYFEPFKVATYEYFIQSDYAIPGQTYSPY
ncbi:MAG: hypothetical protein K9J37_09875 [Saprospiraceae bacterium]|nr:hypothetical protein [Saprospiraceae bacterium]MCF8250211.1 hypothetical protein [Saprospiraceae bacterium]MCF8280026.1 hypothetical protein [Bacteroidales bacterium]MCF8312019.1 hypothetical protein [Saprospiraceae bacterium]MCF8441116.1 hypothetical protein [Saprospiraceae bacterium]